MCKCDNYKLKEECECERGCEGCFYNKKKTRFARRVVDSKIDIIRAIKKIEENRKELQKIIKEERD